MIKKFFEGPEFINQPAAIRGYIDWALRPGGPAYFANPTPKEAKGFKLRKDNLGDTKVCRLHYIYLLTVCAKRIIGSGRLP
jgi:hypothetical protein